MSKGSSPRKVRNDKSYAEQWEVIFGRMGKGREDVQEDGQDGVEQSTVRGLEEDRKPGSQEDTGASA